MKKAGLDSAWDLIRVRRDPDNDDGEVIGCIEIVDSGHVDFKQGSDAGL